MAKKKEKKAGNSRIYHHQYRKRAVGADQCHDILCLCRSRLDKGTHCSGCQRNCESRSSDLTSELVTVNATPNLVYLKFTGEVVQEIKDYSKLLPYAIGNIRIDRDEFSFPDVYRGQQPSMTFSIANLSDRPYEPVLMHLPPYLKMEAEPKVLLKGKKGTIKLTLDASQLQDFGLTQTSVYLSRFSGDKVSEDNEIPVSAILLPDFSRMTEKDSLNAPSIHISETNIDLSIPLIKKNKVSHDILIANAGKTPLVISKLQVFNSSVGVRLKKTVIPPDGMTKLKVTIHKRDVGNKKHHLRILMITNDPLRPKVEINIKR